MGKLSIDVSLPHAVLISMPASSQSQRYPLEVFALLCLSKLITTRYYHLVCIMGHRHIFDSHVPEPLQVHGPSTRENVSYPAARQRDPSQYLGKADEAVQVPFGSIFDL